MDLAMVARWLAGRRKPVSHTLPLHAGGPPWVGLTVVLDLAVRLGYILIARHWWKNQKRYPPSPANRALRNMKLIFIFCGLCGYASSRSKCTGRPGGSTTYSSWSWSISPGILRWGSLLKVVYNELERSAKLAAELRESREESNRKTFFSEPDQPRPDGRRSTGWSCKPNSRR